MYDHFPQFNPTYKARIAEEEDKLRWLVARHPSNRELSYYLIFLLAANEKYAKAIEECRRVLRSIPMIWSRGCGRNLFVSDGIILFADGYPDVHPIEPVVGAVSRIAPDMRSEKAHLRRSGCR